MKKFGTASRKFSRLDDEGIKQQEHPSRGVPSDQQGERHGMKVKSPSSRGKRMIKSVACVAGSPKRIELQDDDHVDDSPSRRQPSTNTKSKASKEDVSNQSHKTKLEPSVNNTNATKAQGQGDDCGEAPLRQQQLDIAMHTIISNEEKEPTATRQYEAVGLKIQPTYDDVDVVFQSPSSDAGTQVSRETKGQATCQAFTNGEDKAKPSPAKPVILQVNNDGVEAVTGPPAISRSTGASAGTQDDSYSHVESLIARVKRLDAVVKAGEDEEVARGVVNEKEGTCFDLEERHDTTVDTEDFVVDKKPETTEPSHDEKSIDSSSNEDHTLRELSKFTPNESLDEKEARENGSPRFNESSPNEPKSTILKPIVSPAHDSPPHQHPKSNRIVTSSPSADEKESSDDGANHFQVIYRRGDDSPRNTHLKTTSVATTTASSIVTVSSFGIPGIQSVQKTTAIVTPIHHRSLRTSHPFFWRTHPKEIFTSYSSTPNRQKTSMAPLKGIKSKAISTKRSSSHGPIRSSRQLRTVEESGEQKHGFRATNPYTFWSKERDPVDDETDLLEDGAADFSPYGDKTTSARRSEPAPLSLVSSGQHTSSDSNPWVVFSEFSLSSTDEFDKS